MVCHPQGAGTQNMMAQYGRTQFMVIGYIVWWYHTPTASRTEKRDREEKARGGEGERREGAPAGRRPPAAK